MILPYFACADAIAGVSFAPERIKCAVISPCDSYAIRQTSYRPGLAVAP